MTKKFELFSKPFQLEDSIPEFFEYNSTTKQVNICFDNQCITYQADNPLDFHKKLSRINSLSNSAVKNGPKITEVFPKRDKMLITNFNSENNIEIFTSEGTNFSPFMNKDYYISKEEIVDISQLNSSQVAMII